MFHTDLDGFFKFTTRTKQTNITTKNLLFVYTIEFLFSLVESGNICIEMVLPSLKITIIIIIIMIEYTKDKIIFVLTSSESVILRLAPSYCLQSEYGHTPVYKETFYL